MVQIKLCVRFESTLDGKTGVDWFVIKQGDIYAVTMLVLVNPVWGSLIEKLASDIFYAKGS